MSERRIVALISGLLTIVLRLQESDRKQTYLLKVKLQMESSALRNLPTVSGRGAVYNSRENEIAYFRE